MQAIKSLTDLDLGKGRSELGRSFLARAEPDTFGSLPDFLPSLEGREHLVLWKGKEHSEPMSQSGLAPTINSPLLRIEVFVEPALCPSFLLLSSSEGFS